MMGDGEGAGATFKGNMTPIIKPMRRLPKFPS